MIRLRGHHLVCLRFFQGQGYSQEFVENLEDMMRRARESEEIEVVSGADDVCRACLSLQGDKCVAKPGMDAKIREMDAEAVAHLGVEVGAKVYWRQITAKVMVPSKGWMAGFCEGCDWEKVCAVLSLPVNG